VTTGETQSGARRPGHADGHRLVALACIAVVFGMLGAAYAAVPLYRLFCQLTGYDGTTMRAAGPSAVVLDRTLTVRFDANVGPHMPWRFEPVQRTLNLRVGETALAVYRATNPSDRSVTGTATFNVTPEVAGAYFNKIACFCFQEQRLEPGQSVEMPVSFFIDPAFVDDKNVAHLTQITLSYTFYPIDGPGGGVAEGAARARPAGGRG
jgi:cytochrome c oxidase assembly protein subunit 11